MQLIVGGAADSEGEPELGQGVAHQRNHLRHVPGLDRLHRHGEVWVINSDILPPPVILAPSCGGALISMGPDRSSFTSCVSLLRTSRLPFKSTIMCRSESAIAIFMPTSNTPTSPLS